MPGEVEVEKPQGQTQAETGKAETGKAPAAASKSVVGIIYPPPEVRSILHKMARLFTAVLCKATLKLAPA
jgi:hypothetical protein